MLKLLGMHIESQKETIQEYKNKMNMEDENRIIIEDEKYEDNLKNRIDCSFDESYLHFIVSHIKKRNGRNN